MMTARTTLLAAGMLGAALLAGCSETSNEPAADASSPAAGQPPVINVPSATPSATAVASIIRPEVVSDPIVDVAPDPLELTLAFPKGSALNPEAEQQLAGVLESEALAEGWPIVVRGHSDSDGTDAANLATSRRRAQAVADWLAGHGVDKARIRVVPLGEQNPAAPNANPDGTPNEAGRARNRRVEISIVAPEGEAAPAPAADQRGPTAAQRLSRD